MYKPVIPTVIVSNVEFWIVNVHTIVSLLSPQNSRIFLSPLVILRIVPASHTETEVEYFPARDEITDAKYICSFSWIHRPRVMLRWGKIVRGLELTCEGLSTRRQGER